MKNFIINIAKFLLILILIVAVPSIFYLKRDVYSDFGRKNNYSWKYFFQPLGDINTKKLIATNNNYNSFIFGSSRSTSVYACYLQKIIPNSKFFHYANWNETIGGVERKLILIDSLNYRIDNVIIYIDNDYTFANDDYTLANEHYLFTHETHSKYLINHYKSFFTNFSIDKLKILIGLPVNGMIFPNWVSDLNTNDPNHICNDSVISSYGNYNQSKSFINMIDSLKRIGFLYERSNKQIYSPNQISADEKKILAKIKYIFEKHKTKYYVIITPLYDQKKFTAIDQKILLDCFDKNLYDFSGINDITNNIYNYPDRKHFQPYISKLILDSILNKNIPKQSTRR